MDEKSAATPAFREITGDEMPGYRRFSLWSVAALVAGLASASAMFSPLLWPVAGVGLLIGVLAVQSVLRQGPQSDPTLATIGLALALLFVSAAPTRYFLRQYHIGNQGDEIGEEWLGYIMSGKPYMAFESRMPVESRRPLDPALLKTYADDSGRAGLYRDFLNSPIIKALTLLPATAQVRHYETESVDPNLHGEGDFITEVFAVTYVEKGQQKSFFVRIGMWRRDAATSTRGLWQIIHYEGGVQPRGLKRSTPPNGKS